MAFVLFAVNIITAANNRHQDNKQAPFRLRA